MRRRTYANPASKLALSFRAQRGIYFQLVILRRGFCLVILRRGVCLVILRRGSCAEGPMHFPPANSLCHSERSEESASGLSSRGAVLSCHPEARFLRRRTYALPASKLALSFRAQRGICFQRAQNASMSVVRMINSLGSGQFEVIGQLSDSRRDFLRSHV